MSLLDAVAGGLIAGRTNRKFQEGKSQQDPTLWSNYLDAVETIKKIQNGCAGQYGGRFKQPCLLCYGSYYVQDINVSSRAIAKFTDRDRQYHSDHPEDPPVLGDSYAATLTVLWYLAGKSPKLRWMVKYFEHWQQMYRITFFEKMVNEYPHLDACQKLIDHVLQNRIRFIKCYLIKRPMWVKYYLVSGCSIGSIPGLESHVQ